MKKIIGGIVIIGLLIGGYLQINNAVAADPLVNTFEPAPAAVHSWSTPAGVRSTLGGWTNGFAAPSSVHLLEGPGDNLLIWDGKIGACGEANCSSDTFVYNPNTGASTDVMTVANRPFCSGHTYLADGRIAIVGGHAGTRADGNAIGNKGLEFFDWKTQSYTKGPDMSNLRWYPSVAATETGIIAMGGTANPSPVNAIEYFVNATQQWITSASTRNFNKPDQPFYSANSYYDHIFENTSGNLAIFAGPVKGLFNTVTNIFTAMKSDNGTNTYSSSALPYFTSDDPQAIIFGGGIPAADEPASNTAFVGNPETLGEFYTTDIPDNITGAKANAPSGLRHQLSALTSHTVASSHMPGIVIAGGYQDQGTSSYTGYNLIKTNSSQKTVIFDADIGQYIPMADIPIGSEFLYHSTIAGTRRDTFIMCTGWIPGGAPPPELNYNTCYEYYPPYLFNVDGSLKDRPIVGKIYTINENDITKSVSTEMFDNEKVMVLDRSITTEWKINVPDTDVFFAYNTDGSIHLPDAGDITLRKLTSSTHGNNFGSNVGVPMNFWKIDKNTIGFAPEELKSMKAGLYRMFVISNRDNKFVPSMAITILVK
jgi:hypothetical protein